YVTKVVGEGGVWNGDGAKAFKTYIDKFVTSVKTSKGELDNYSAALGDNGGAAKSLTTMQTGFPEWKQGVDTWLQNHPDDPTYNHQYYDKMAVGWITSLAKDYEADG